MMIKLVRRLQRQVSIRARCRLNAVFLANDLQPNFIFRGYTSIADAPAEAQLIATLAPVVGIATADEPLGRARLAEILKDFFGEVADLLPKEKGMAIVIVGTLNFSA